MIRICGLRKSFDVLSVLDGVELSVADGEIVAVVGPSGCGKSTLLNIVAGLEEPDAGAVDIGGARIGYVFQEDRLLPWRTVAENIGLSRDPFTADEVDELIGLVGLTGFSSQYPDALSGGMRQRCSLARAYHARCDVLLMDEPFISLDPPLRREMLELLLTIWRRRRNAILFVTHDIDEALSVAARVVVMGPRPSRILAEFSLGVAEAVRTSPSRAVHEEISRLLVVPKP